MGWNGAGGCVIVSHSRQEKRSRTVWITFHWRGTTSSVSVTSSPSFDSLFEPQQGQDVGAGDHHALARQITGERLSRRPLAFEGFDDLLGPRRLLGGQFVLGSGGLSVLQLQFQLVEQALLSFGAHAKERAFQLLDLELQIDDEGLGARSGATARIPFGFTPPRAAAVRSASIIACAAARSRGSASALFGTSEENHSS